MNAFDFRLLMAALASYRIAQAFVYDEGPWSIFLWLRVKAGVYDLAANGHPTTRLGRLMSCPYCVGVYTSLLCIVPVLLPGSVGDVILLFLGVTGAQALMTAWTAKHD